MHQHTIVVDGYVAAEDTEIDLREEVWAYALDQRTFGPRRLLVAFADAGGRLRGLAYTARTDPPELALEACLRYLGEGAEAAIAFCDEPVTAGPPSPEIIARLYTARALAATFGVDLVDWFACDDLQLRSFQLAVHPDDEWWAIGGRGS